MKYMLCHSRYYVVKILAIGGILYVSEAGFLLQLIYCGCIEFLMLLHFMIEEPYVDPWMDFLAKVGAVHQVLQVGLLCFFRVEVAVDPTKPIRYAAWIMAAFTGLYCVFTWAATLAVTVRPAVKRYVNNSVIQLEETKSYKKWKKEKLELKQRRPQ